MVELRKITEDNLSAVLALNVSENQRHHIDAGGNMAALAFAYAWTVEKIEVHAFAIHINDEAVGLMMYKNEMIDFGEEEFHDLPCYGKVVWWIDYFMIDTRHQGKGYGKLAFEKLLENIEKTAYGINEYAMIRYSADNDIVRSLYASFGFEELFTLEDGSYALKQLMR